MTRAEKKLDDLTPSEAKVFIRQLSDKLAMAEIMTEEECQVSEAITQELKEIYDLIKQKL